VPEPARREALSALPSPAARALAFVSILVAGLAGGFIGWAFVDLQSDSTVAAAVGGLVGAVAAAAGVAVVAVLVLRALGEWRQLGEPGDPQRR
jgi:hypothetical protein